MSGRRTRRRSTVSRGLHGLSVVALCAFVIGAVFLLTSNQGCMRMISRPSAGQSAATPAPAPTSPDSDKDAGDESKDEKQADSSAPSQEETDQSETTDKPADQPQQAAEPSDPPAPEPAARPVPMPRDVPGEVSHGSTGSPRIALTFDAGADSRPTDKILKALAAHGVHATFFLTGKWIEKNPAICRRIVAEGHEIGNHSYSHRSFTQLSDSEIGTELERTEELAVKVTGASTKPLWRPPYGARDKRVLRTVGGYGYRSVYWHVDCWDSVKKGITPDQITSRVLSRVGNGSIVLMHCGSQATADALDGLLSRLKARGYQQVTVGTLVGS